MKITDALLGEHAMIYRLLDHCSAGADAWSLEEARTAGGTLAAALLAHAHVEDELLFRALEPHLSAAAGPLAVMRQEHDEIEGSLARLAEARDAESARMLLRYATSVARQHFAKEEQVLFPMAEQFLSPERLNELGGQWSERAVGVHS